MSFVISLDMSWNGGCKGTIIFNTLSEYEPLKTPCTVHCHRIFLPPQESLNLFDSLSTCVGSNTFIRPCLCHYLQTVPFDIHSGTSLSQQRSWPKDKDHFILGSAISSRGNKDHFILGSAISSRGNCQWTPSANLPLVILAMSIHMSLCYFSNYLGSAKSVKASSLSSLFDDRMTDFAKRFPLPNPTDMRVIGHVKGDLACVVREYRGKQNVH